MITESKIINGIRNFVDNEVLPCIPEQGTKIVIATGISMITRNESMIQKYLSSIPYDAERGYDISVILDELGKSINKYGKLDVKIPSIPLISKDEKTLSFTSADIAKLKDYIERSD